MKLTHISLNNFNIFILDENQLVLDNDDVMSGNLYKEVWQFALKEIEKEYKEKNNLDEFNMWFNMNYVEDNNNIITVSVASAFMQQMMRSKGYFDIIQNKIKELTEQNIVINGIVKNENLFKGSESSKSYEQTVKDESYDSNENTIRNPLKFNIDFSEEENEEPEIKQVRKHPLLQTQFTFDTFVPGENCNFAYNASIAVAKNPGKQYNPILIYGGSGLGKTHLMQAIGNYIYNNSESNPKIYYGSAESFANEFTTSLANKKVQQFNNKFRNLDVLLIDDIHFLESKKGIQEELFYTFNALHDKKAQMVFTCDRPLKEIKNMTDRLVSRLSNGLCIDITIPNYETRYAILQNKIENMGKYLDPSIIDYIASSIETNVRDLEAALNRIFGYQELTGQNLSLESAKNQLNDLLKNSQPENISLDTIQRVIADNYNISVADLKSKRKDKKFVIPRQISIYIARELTELSYTELGNEYGGKDHTTIMHSYEKVSDLIKTDQNLDAKIKLFIKEIKEYKK